jgi:regulator of replication initiation timing
MEDTMTDLQFKSIIKMAQQIVERSKDLDDAKKALKEILEEKDTDNES